MQHFFKLVLITASLCTVFISDNSSAKSTTLVPVKPKIVGGEVAAEGQWPWMSALVYTASNISTTLTVDNINYNSQAFTGGVLGNATGDIVDCGIADTQCANATNKICLIERGDIDFSVKVENCQAGGGIGAIIYNNVAGVIQGTLGENFSGTIPAISVTQTDGSTLQEKIGKSATLTVAEGTSIAQSSTCGASFIGDKWVLTASHCVEGVSAELLKVNVGEYDLSNGAENAKAIKRIYMHPDYQLNVELDNDIALIELVDSVNNPAITLVDLPTTEQFAQQNNTVTVAGWGGRLGYEAGGGPTADFPDVLHQVDLQLSTNQECKNILAQSFSDNFEGRFTADQIGVTDAMICAFVADGGKASCQGDSGGPLMIETNAGWQQIGIVSWGIGCAAEGFPGVYTRTAVFENWIKEISQGIAIDQSLDFTIQAMNKPQRASVDVVNNSTLDTNLTFAVIGDPNFTIVNNNCSSLSASTTCTLEVNYDAAQVGKHSAKITITSDNAEIPTSTTHIVARTIALASEIKTQLSSSDNALTWYSGGSDEQSVWQLDNTEAAIISGDIADEQQSIVMVSVAEAGELSFEWSVSSEENTDDPTAPFDALYLYVDGELINFISGEVAYQRESVSFGAGEHVITWVYEKDASTFDGDDNAHLRNVVFTPTPVVTPPVTQKSNSGGGSIAWFSLIFIVIMCLRRK